MTASAQHIQASPDEDTVVLHFELVPSWFLGSNV